MAGIEIHDTYGSIFGSDQMCDCDIGHRLRLGDTLTLDTEFGAIPFTVTLLENYFEDGELSSIAGVGLTGPDAELIMPGDTLDREGPGTLGSPATTLEHVTVGNDRNVEVNRQLLGV